METGSWAYGPAAAGVARALPEGLLYVGVFNGAGLIQ